MAGRAGARGRLLGFAMAVAGALVGAWLGARLSEDRTPSPALRGVRRAPVAIFALAGYGLLHAPRTQGVRATVTLAQHRRDGRAPRPAGAAPRRQLADRHRLAGRRAGRRPPASETAPGVYRTTRPLPLDGDWKTMIRLHRGNALTALPVYLPADPAIPVEGVPARARRRAPFGPEQKLLQRERKTAAGWLWGAAYATVLPIALGFLVALAWGVHRVSRPSATRPPRASTAPPRPTWLSSFLTGERNSKGIPLSPAGRRARARPPAARAPRG